MFAAGASPAGCASGGGWAAVKKEEVLVVLEDDDEVPAAACSGGEDISFEKAEDLRSTRECSQCVSIWERPLLQVAEGSAARHIIKPSCSSPSTSNLAMHHGVST